MFGETHGVIHSIHNSNTIHNSNVAILPQHVCEKKLYQSTEQGLVYHNA